MDASTLGILCRVAAPLLVGARAIGLISVSRRGGRRVRRARGRARHPARPARRDAVQNIRAYESERRTVEELRRLSALRADFVSLVSHELRSPMAAVIGASRTLQERWRELQPDQREAFLALIADETTRLATLDRRRARHLAHRRRHVHLPLHRRRSRRARAPTRSPLPPSGRTRCRSSRARAAAAARWSAATASGCARCSAT